MVITLSGKTAPTEGTVRRVRRSSGVVDVVIPRLVVTPPLVVTPVLVVFPDAEGIMRSFIALPSSELSIIAMCRRRVEEEEEVVVVVWNGHRKKERVRDETKRQ